MEMQLSDEKNIPKRMRYYAGTIDQTILETGINYSALTGTGRPRKTKCKMEERIYGLENDTPQ